MTPPNRNTARAKSLRNVASPPERLLWQNLRNRQLGGHKFNRQMPVGPYFADFLCREFRLIVELDGISHDTALTMTRGVTPIAVTKAIPFCASPMQMC